MNVQFCRSGTRYYGELNDESMGDHTYYFNRPNEVTKYDWVDSGQDFYFKFTNKMGSKTISGSYEIFMD